MHTESTHARAEGLVVAYNEPREDKPLLFLSTFLYEQ